MKLGELPWAVCDIDGFVLWLLDDRQRKYSRDQGHNGGIGQREVGAQLQIDGLAVIQGRSR